MSNPYQSPNATSPQTDDVTTHPDWKWMALFAYGFCVLCMIGVIGKTNPPNTSLRGFGHGFIRAPFFLGDIGFMVAIPFLSLIPAFLVAVPFRFIYRRLKQTNPGTFVNFLMLLLAAIVAIVNASHYRGD